MMKGGIMNEETLAVLNALLFAGGMVFIVLCMFGFAYLIGGLK